MSIGLVKKTSSLCKLPGMESGTIGYLDNGRSVKGQSPEPYAQPYKVNDVVGCGINFPKQAVFFTKNGQQFGNKFLYLCYFAVLEFYLFHIYLARIKYSYFDIHV